jgi:hypothetical protein
VVRAKAPLVRTSIDGTFPLRVALRSDTGTSSAVPEDPAPESEYASVASGRLCLLAAQRRLLPVNVDGRLEDWAQGTTNIASDFILVGALDVPKRRRLHPNRASSLTTVFVCHDKQYLYIAFNCEDNRMSERTITRSNYVRYDDLWPVGEDLVEVVLDPTGKAVDPGDLLHIVVKANGAVISEQGFPCLNRVASHARWTGEVIAAIDDESQPDRWTVEIRIPLSALDERADVLGINFARFHTRLGEYSSWSGARSHLYTPTALGNMRLQP